MNDLWSFDPGKNEWNEEQTSETKPSPRHGHSATVLSDGSVILMGGTDTEGNSFHDCWKLNPDKSYTSLPCPFAFSNHSAELAGDTIFIFDEPGKVVTYNVSTKKWNAQEGGPPIWGHAASAVRDNEQGEKIIIIFGGVAEGGVESDIVYDYNTTAKTLSQRENRMPFPYSCGASAVLHDQKNPYLSIDVLFFGGMSAQKHIDTTFLFSAGGEASPHFGADLNNDSAIDMADAVLALRLLVDPLSISNIVMDKDINGDNVFGLQEAIYISFK